MSDKTGGDMTRTVFFDLDGTLLDPRVGITTSIQYALRCLGEPAPSADELTWCIGPPLLDSFRALGLENERASQALDLYRERFVDLGWRENVSYPGVPEALATLTDAGFRLFLATSKPRVFAVKIVEHFDLHGFFNDIYGAELDGTRSDKIALLDYAAADSKLTSSATMVGDREHDVTGALNNRMEIIGVTYGYGSREELLHAGAVRLADTPAEVVNLLVDGG